MEIVDSRRLTGINLFCAEPGAVADVRFAADEDPAAIVRRWRMAVGRGLAQLGWAGMMHVRTGTDPAGVAEASLMVTADLDRLYAATELNEWALATATGEDGSLHEIAESARREQAKRRGVRPLLAAARDRGIPALVDDDELSLGYGKHSHTWSLDALPDPSMVDWASCGRIPLALVTGTNGKTTTTRLLARMLRQAGQRTGNSSTDGLYVDGELADAGDWTGPGAARALLRRRDLDAVVLEVARGGILRRGLEVTADVAVITNVEADHLGQYGIHDAAGMAEAKGLVAQAVHRKGRLVLGADSAALVQWAREHAPQPTIEWFSPDADNPVLQAHLAAGGTVWTVVDGALARRRGDEVTKVLAVAEAPLTIEGKARHNVANALGACAVATALGVPIELCAAALRTFGADPADNPGRARAWTLGDDIQLLFDFAHNQAGMEALAHLVEGLGRRTIMCFGMAGDRSDEDLRELGRALGRFSPHEVILREQPVYQRGRPRGVVPQLLADGVRAAGIPDAEIHFADDEVASLRLAYELADPGDLIILLIHTEPEPVAEWLAEVGARDAVLQPA